MIFDILLTVLTKTSELLGAIMPNVDLSDIPFIGDTVRSTLVTVMGVWNSFMESFPYAYVLWYTFLALIAFELLLLGLKFILGSRVPTHS